MKSACILRTRSISASLHPTHIVGTPCTLGVYLALVNDFLSEALRLHAVFITCLQWFWVGWGVLRRESSTFFVFSQHGRRLHINFTTTWSSNKSEFHDSLVCRRRREMATDLTEHHRSAQPLPMATTLFSGKNMEYDEVVKAPSKTDTLELRANLLAVSTLRFRFIATVSV